MTRLIWGVLVAAVISCQAVETADAWGFSVCKLVRSHGYPCEDHNVQTEDGWTLQMQRIPAAKAGAEVVMFQHGLFDTAAGALINYYRGPDGEEVTGFPYVIRDAGYDMWLGNNRGNGISMTNAHYNVTDRGFWAFSYDEMAKYDMPAQIDYVLQTTGKAKLTYIGHSQGTVQAFAALSTPATGTALAAKLNLFIALAPIAYVHHVTSPLLQVGADLHIALLDYLLTPGALSLPNVTQALLPAYCAKHEEECNLGLELIMGPATDINKTRLADYMTYEPNPTSAQNMMHWSQGVRVGSFQMFSYPTEEENMEHYNSTVPPQYDLGKIPADLPIALFTGGNDWLADPTDVELMKVQLPSTPFVHYEPDANHLTPIWGDDSDYLMYPVMLNLIRNATAAPSVPGDR